MRRLRAAALALLAGTGAAAAAERPLWEIGLGAAGLHLPHYRGSDRSHAWLLPLPYLVYRGAIFKADRDGARALLYDSDRLDLDLSLAAGVPTRSSDNDARRGMDDLAPIVEIGPNLDWTLMRGTRWRLGLRVPVRAAVTVESRPQAIGWTATPHLRLEAALQQGWRLGLQAGPVAASRRYHAYYYEVDAADATAARPAYRARGGYGGTQATATLSRRYARSWVGAFVRHDGLGGARFGDSPLVRDRSQFSVGIAFAWVLGQSARTVATDGD